MSKQDLTKAIEDLKMQMSFNECADDFYYSNGRYAADKSTLAALEAQLAAL